MGQVGPEVLDIHDLLEHLEYLGALMGHAALGNLVLLVFLDLLGSLVVLTVLTSLVVLGHQGLLDSLLQCCVHPLLAILLVQGDQVDCKTPLAHL